MINPLDYRGKCFLNKLSESSTILYIIREFYTEDFAFSHSENMIQYYCIEFDFVEIDINAIIVETGIQKSIKAGDLNYFYQKFKSEFGEEISEDTYSEVKLMAVRYINLAKIDLVNLLKN